MSTLYKWICNHCGLSTKNIYVKLLLSHPGTGFPATPGGGYKWLPNPTLVDVMAEPVSKNQMIYKIHLSITLKSHECIKAHSWLSLF